jgi:hypothetical protein
MTTLQGIVLDPAGRPVAGAAVYFTVVPGFQPDIALLTAEDGTFRVPVKMPGTYRVGARTEGYQRGETEVLVAGEEQIEFTIRLKENE